MNRHWSDVGVVEHDREPLQWWHVTARLVELVLRDPYVYVLAVVMFVAWCAAQAIAGEPGLPADSSIAPAVYVVEGPVQP